MWYWVDWDLWNIIVIFMLCRYIINYKSILENYSPSIHAELALIANMSRGTTQTFHNTVRRDGASNVVWTRARDALVISWSFIITNFAYLAVVSGGVVQANAYARFRITFVSMAATFAGNAWSVFTTVCWFAGVSGGATLCEAIDISLHITVFDPSCRLPWSTKFCRIHDDWVKIGV